MSIIERAINKLDGKPDGDNPSSEKIDKSERAPHDESQKPVTAPPVSAEVSAPTKQVSEAPVNPPPNLAPVEKQTPTRHKTPTSIINLDNERLAAGGFLSMDAGATRQAEEYQQVKRRLLGNTVEGMQQNDKPANLVMITSSVPGEGKTFTSVNMVLSFAMEIDHTILAVDTDIVKRDMTRVFGALERPGLYDFLADPTMEISEVMFRTSLPNLVLIPAGQNKSGRTELLASARMKELTEELATRYKDRLVLFDTPPILATSTAMALAPQVGQFVLVVEANKTKHETLRNALDMIDNTPITGLVLNKSKQVSRRSYDYYGYYVNRDAD